MYTCGCGDVFADAYDYADHAFSCWGLVAKITTRQVKKWMLATLVNDIHGYYFDVDGCVLCTKLAEDAAWQYPVYVSEDGEIAKVLFELAFEAAQLIEREV